MQHWTGFETQESGITLATSELCRDFQIDQKRYYVVENERVCLDIFLLVQSQIQAAIANSTKNILATSEY